MCDDASEEYHLPAWCNKNCSRICDMEQQTAECRDCVLLYSRAVQSR